MHRTTNRTCLVVGALLVAALAVAPALAGDPSKMAERLAKWEGAYNAGDVKALAAHYTEDATRLPYQAPTISGRVAIADHTTAIRDQGAVKIELELLGAEAQGKIGWGHGTYHLMDAEGATIQKGKWMNVSKKVGGKWLIQSDIWNTDAPE
jgi:ketosteroid isomerase-like protein